MRVAEGPGELGEIGMAEPGLGKFRHSRINARIGWADIVCRGRVRRVCLARGAKVRRVCFARGVKVRRVCFARGVKVGRVCLVCRVGVG